MRTYKVGDKFKSNLGESEIIALGAPGYYIHSINGKWNLLICTYEDGYEPLDW